MFISFFSHTYTCMYVCVIPDGKFKFFITPDGIFSHAHIRTITRRNKSIFTITRRNFYFLFLPDGTTARKNAKKINPAEKLAQKFMAACCSVPPRSAGFFIGGEEPKPFPPGLLSKSRRFSLTFSVEVASLFF